MICSLSDSMIFLVEFLEFDKNSNLTQISRIAWCMSHMDHFDGAFYGTFAFFLKLESSMPFIVTVWKQVTITFQFSLIVFYKRK